MRRTQKIGWLGTGRMGSAMTFRLLDADHEVAVWNRTAAKTAPLVQRGARRVDSPRDLTTCDVVFVMVTSSPDLLAVTTGPDGLLTGGKGPRLVVDCSTVSAQTSAQVREAAASLGVGFLSAPISGNPDMVAAGRAAIVASGPADVFAETEHLLTVIAPTVVYAGPEEESRLVKLGHNLLLGMLTEALAEVTTLAEKGGVAPADFLDFIDGSVLASTFLRHKGDAIRRRDYTPTFTAENLRKDFDLGLAAARTLEVPMPLAASTHQLVQTAIGYGHRDDDYVALYEIASRAAGLDHDS